MPTVVWDLVIEKFEKKLYAEKAISIFGLRNNSHKSDFFQFVVVLNVFSQDAYGGG